jgi:O-acetyl-ADP-ribose deacetylase (regulator of RNase III)
LPAQYVIHTVGPVWNGGGRNEEALLADCYRNSLRLAVEKEASTIAFPGISTGIYHFPKVKAAQIAVQEVKAFLDGNPSLAHVVFVVFDEESYQVYQSLLQ